MSDQFTPGPWKVYKTRDGVLTLGIGVDRPGDPDHAVGVTDRDFGLWGDGGERAANARLIAAAPDLLAALEELLRHYVDLANSGDAGFWDPEEEPQIIDARAAIAKVRGQS